MSKCRWLSNCLIFSYLIGEILYLLVSTTLPGVGRSSTLLSGISVSLHRRQVLGLAAGILAADVGFLIMSAATRWGTCYPHCLQAVAQVVFTVLYGSGKG